MAIQLITMVGFAYFIEDRWRFDGTNYLHGYKYDNKCSSVVVLGKGKKTFDLNK